MHLRKGFWFLDANQETRRGPLRGLPALPGKSDSTMGTTTDSADVKRQPNLRLTSVESSQLVCVDGTTFFYGSECYIS